MTILNSIGLYIHIPWCIKKCPYCDFNSHVSKSVVLENQYVEVLLDDLRQDLSLLNTTYLVNSIFIGGGTPSLFSVKSLDKLLNEIFKFITLADNLEITLEANPKTVESKKFAEFRAIGINRLSIGIQSFNDQHLLALGRVHSTKEALAAVAYAYAAGFTNLNLDLMFGLPKQTDKTMLNDINTAISLEPSHISFYQLTLEPNTYFYKFPPHLPSNDEICCGLNKCQQLLATAGYKRYEVSAYAKTNLVCQHNLNYWKFGDYLGIGAGAHGKLSTPKYIIRTTKLKSPTQYLSNNTATIARVLEEHMPLEFLMNQLRLKSGFSIEHYQKSTGLKITTLEPTLSSCVNQGLLLKQDRIYKCSDKGWNFLDTILTKFIP